jgi:hypothetical protein
VAKRAERVQARCRDRDPVLLLPTLAEAACRCTSTTSVTGRTTTVCRCPLTPPPAPAPPRSPAASRRFADEPGGRSRPFNPALHAHLIALGYVRHARHDRTEVGDKFPEQMEDGKHRVG